MPKNLIVVLRGRYKSSDGVVRVKAAALLQYQIRETTCSTMVMRSDIWCRSSNAYPLGVRGMSDVALKRLPTSYRYTLQ